MKERMGVRTSGRRANLLVRTIGVAAVGLTLAGCALFSSKKPIEEPVRRAVPTQPERKVEREQTPVEEQATARDERGEETHRVEPKIWKPPERKFPRYIKPPFSYSEADLERMNPFFYGNLIPRFGMNGSIADRERKVPRKEAQEWFDLMVNGLRHPDQEIQRFCIMQLLFTYHPVFERSNWPIELMIEIASDPSEDENVRCKIIDLCLSDYKEPGPIRDRIIALLKNLIESEQPVYVQAEAIETLGELRAVEEIPFLTSIVGNSTIPRLIQEALRVLGLKFEYGSTSAVPTISNIALTHDDKIIRILAMDALGRIPCTESIETLERIALSELVYTRPALMIVIHDPYPYTLQEAAVDALQIVEFVRKRYKRDAGRTPNDARGIPSLMRVAREGKHPKVRWRAVDSLRQLIDYSSEIVPFLRRLRAETSDPEIMDTIDSGFGSRGIR